MRSPFVLVLVVVACGDDHAIIVDAGQDASTLDAPDGGDTCACVLGAVTPTGSILSDETRELSGIATSRALGDVVWTHNDSGDTARLFATRVTGELLGIVSRRTGNRGNPEHAAPWSECVPASASFNAW